MVEKFNVYEVVNIVVEGLVGMGRWVNSEKDFVRYSWDGYKENLLYSPYYHFLTMPMEYGEGKDKHHHKRMKWGGVAVTVVVILIILFVALLAFPMFLRAENAIAPNSCAQIRMDRCLRHCEEKACGCKDKDDNSSSSCGCH